VGLIGFLQRLASMLDPSVAMPVAVAAAGLSVLAVGAARGRAARRDWFGPGAFLLLSGAWLTVSSLLGLEPARLWWVGAAALAILVGHVIRRPARPEEPVPGVGAGRTGRIALAASVAVVAVLMLRDLGGYAGTMMVWEPSVVDGFGRALRSGTGVLRFTRDRLLWDDGLVSRGDGSLLYGAGTYALFHLAGLSLWTLRLVAAVLALLSPPALYLLLRRRYPTGVAALAGALLAVSPVLLYYGRYGTSLTGTLLALVLALGATLWLLDRGWQRWWGGAACGAALFLATLGYSPARLVVLGLALVAVAALAVRGRGLGRRGAISLSLLLVVLAAAWLAQRASGTAPAFVRARGESILTFLRQPDYMREFLGRPVEPGSASPSDRVELIARVLQRTVPELGRVLTYPLRPKLTRNQVLEADPPLLPLLTGALLPFVAWGFVVTLRRLRSPPHMILLVWFAVAVGPLLLTTRVDVHRLMVVVVPMVLWGAIGLVEAGRALAAAGVPSLVGGLLVAALLGGSVLWSSTTLCFLHPPSHRLGAAVIAELHRVAGPVEVAAVGDHREVGRIDLALLARVLRDPDSTARLLPEATLRGLLEGGASPAFESALEHCRPRHGTLLLVPAEPFRYAAFELQQQGLSVARVGDPEVELWRVEPAGRAGGQVTVEIASPPTPVPTPPRIQLETGPQVQVSSLEPLEVRYGFEPPYVDQTWGGGPIVLGGVRYRHGLGMHAWCRMTYAVPEGATAFQAVVGLADSQRSCPAALVTFEVGGGDGEPLFDSGPVGPTTPPQRVLVALHGERTVTLSVTEAGNGRDCDHASWAEPAFLLGPR